jgi:ubiquinone/menaquinone biosynthesis C-methylase UbiE
MPATLSAFLSTATLIDDIYQLSPPRAFQHEEELYDRNRPQDSRTPEFLQRQGEYILSFVQDQGFRPGQAILEIGCGTGWVSTAIASRPEVGHLLCTDPSPAFARMTRQRLKSEIVVAPRVDCGVLLAEDIDLIPPGAVSLILLRSVLHHIADIPDFLRRCAAVLPPGGLLVCEEPFYDGYLMMGFLAQFIPGALAADGYECTPEEQAHVDMLVATIQFYARRDVDKSQAEDKHLFRPDELHVQGRDAGLELATFPNWYFTAAPELNRQRRVGHFKSFFGHYIERCMFWPPEFCARVTAATARYFRYFEPLETESSVGPYCFGTFVFTKRR